MCSRFYPLFVFFVNPLGTVIFRYTCYNYNNNDNNNNNNNNKYSFSSGVGYAMRLILLIMWTAFQSFILRHNNGNFICVFECTIVNLATYRQFTNAA